MSDKRRRQNAIRFRIDGTEEAFIQKAAADAGIPIATFARQAVMAAAKPAPGDSGIEKSTAIALRDILAEINHIAAVTRKRAIHSDDADRVVNELRRLQILLFRFYYRDTTR
jgi:hypothetical protein